MVLTEGWSTVPGDILANRWRTKTVHNSLHNLCILATKYARKRHFNPSNATVTHRFYIGRELIGQFQDRPFRPLTHLSGIAF